MRVIGLSLFYVREFSFVLTAFLRLLCTRPRIAIKKILNSNLLPRGATKLVSNEDSVQVPYLESVLDCDPKECDLNNLKSYNGRILFFINNSLPYVHSGYTERTQKTLESLKSQGLKPFAVTRNGFPLSESRLAPKPKANVNGVEYNFVIPWLSLSSQLAKISQTINILARISVRRDPDIIHTTTPFLNGIIASRLASQLGVPWIYEARGEPEKTWLAKQNGRSLSAPERAIVSTYVGMAREQETKIARSANALVVLSEVSAIEWNRRGVPLERIHVIPNSLDEGELEEIFRYHREYPTSYSREDFRRQLRSEKLSGQMLPPNALLVGTVTSVVHYEGIDTMIRALECVGETSRPVYLLVVGDGPDMSSVREIANKSSISHRIVFVGRKPRSDIQNWYKMLDVFLLTRKPEDVCRMVTPLKALIAQGLKIPVIASDLPALREVTGGFAEFVQAGDVQAIAKILEALANVETSVEDAPDFQISEGYKHAIHQSWQQNARQLKNLYSRLSNDGSI